MAQAFNRIVIFARQKRFTHAFEQTLSSLQQILEQQQIEILLEQETAQYLPQSSAKAIAMTDLDKQCDLIMVVGGDGSMLEAARSAVEYDIPILGINRGRLGFLTDILPAELEQKITDLLKGQYREEQRFLLQAQTVDTDNTYQSDALNDVVLLPGNMPHMIEFEILINDEAVCSQRADGLITATPTGSTAYALSGGGPILHPNLEAIVLVPMFSHTLSARPIVVEANHKITIVIDKANDTSPQLSCDGQELVTINPGGKIEITKKSKQLRLIHPLDYNYYQTLRSKLGWQTKH